jgi:hypothetical protein
MKPVLSFSTGIYPINSQKLKKRYNYPTAGIMKPSTTLLLARLTIALVFLWNIQCAFAFLSWPERFTAGFELNSAPGEAALRGLGVLFLMWNIPYAVALWNPVRHRISLYEANAMQAIGLLGETLIWGSQPPAHSELRASLLRFITFDGAGLALLLLAIWLARRSHRNNHGET